MVESGSGLGAIKSISAALLCCSLGGCATTTVNQMAFDEGARSVDTARKSVVLLTIDVFRPEKSVFEPVPSLVNVERPSAQSKQDRQNFVLDKDKDSVKDEGGHTLFLVRMALEPGPYQLSAVTGFAAAFPISGTFEVPLLADFNVQPRTIVYVGRVTATLRSRESGEFRAGPVIPLIDQSVSGMSRSTWDVTINDRSDKDVPLLRQKFKALESASIISSPLPSFDRMAIQRWWNNSLKQ